VPGSPRRSRASRTGVVEASGARPITKWVLAVYLLFIGLTLPVGDNPLMWLWPGLIYLAFAEVVAFSWPVAIAVSYVAGAGFVYFVARILARRMAPATPGQFLRVAGLAHGALPLLALAIYLVGRLAGLAYVG
jgi:hypothetical protein